MTICRNCEEGEVALGEHFVTHDMAIDAGDRSLEGQSMGIEWGQCPCCYGDWQDCQRCKEDEQNESTSD